MKDSLAKLPEWQIGAGINRGTAWPAETKDMPYVNAINSGYITADIVKANVFAPYKTPLSGGDLAGTLYGQSGYGNTVWTVLADNMTELGKKLAGVPENIKTIRSIANLMLGKVG